VPAKGFDRGAVGSILSAGWTALFSWARCVGLLRRWKPDVVIGFGGYVSLPLGLASVSAGIPLVLHEQNAVPGLANRFLSRWASAVCVTFPESITRLRRPSRAHVTGNPVRPEVASASRDLGRKALGLKKSDLVLLVFGGSRGARHLNEAVLALYPRLKERQKLRVVHIAGPQEIDAVRTTLTEVAGADCAWWKVYDYIEAMGDAMAAADLVVCRSGATTLAELSALGRPAVLVPYPFATADHQTQNAGLFVQAGAATIVYDQDLDGPTFGDEIMRLLGKPKLRSEMAEAATSLYRALAAHAIAEVAAEQAAGYRGRMRARRDDGSSVEENAS
jgi:UDP-N-acetylglucosamine--N-acetylmuramyl-(pentapeptide) pyrophosphoryl-undecaprenol N-acetylglucosamine transferase